MPYVRRPHRRAAACRARKQARVLCTRVTIKAASERGGEWALMGAVGTIGRVEGGATGLLTTPGNAVPVGRPKCEKQKQEAFGRQNGVL